MVKKALSSASSSSSPERRLQNPSTVSILSCPSPAPSSTSSIPSSSLYPTSLPAQLPRPSLISGRQRSGNSNGLSRQPTFALDVEPPRQRPTYSSATSWKHEKDRTNNPLGAGIGGSKVKVNEIQNGRRPSGGFEGRKSLQGLKVDKMRKLPQSTKLVPPPALLGEPEEV